MSNTNIDAVDRECQERICFALKQAPATRRWMVDKLFALSATYDDVDRALRRLSAKETIIYRSAHGDRRWHLVTGCPCQICRPTSSQEQRP